MTLEVIRKYMYHGHIPFGMVASITLSSHKKYVTYQLVSWTVVPRLLLTAKQGDNRIGSVRPSVCPSVRLYVIASLR